MNKSEQQRLLALGKKHKKFFEDVSINLDGYKVSGRLFYLARYTGKFRTKSKGDAVISLEKHTPEEAQRALLPLVSYFITWNNISDSIGERAQVDFSILEEVRDYLERIVNADIATIDIPVYKRSLSVIQSMLDLQKNMKQLWQEASQFDKHVKEKDYFTDSEIDQLIMYNIEGGWIQYAQLKDRYQHRRDFDVVYANRDKPDIKKYDRFSDKHTLYNMTSDCAAEQLRQNIDQMTDGKAPMDYDTYIDYFYNVYKERLKERVETLKKTLRYP
ncbi:hypothetical protein [Lentibacillus sp. JNUCC-1]|uniref:hypothetical protein n=1 Tax=Lentibacillus sp. JNUCC-1 TaxID=2654513 RepID=UPI0018D1F6D5|nr:hypothetical protein [Lentibacillus sp. JNUCC-1]